MNTKQPLLLDVDGFVADGFGPVLAAFEENFRRRGELGAALAVYRSGTLVVDLAAGVADVATRRPYERSTLQFVFSTSKGITAICIHHLASGGILDLDAPVASYWPEFGQRGKEGVLLRSVLAHRAGLPVIDGSFTFDELLDTAVVDAALEAQPPLWEPESRHGYHPITYGWILDGIVRRVTGQTVGSYFRTEIAEPLGLDCWLGLPEAQFGRVAPVIDMPPMRPKLKDLKLLVRPALVPHLAKIIKAIRDPNSTVNRGTYLNGTLKSGDGSLIWNRPELWSAGWPAAAAITDARSLARLYAATVGSVDGVRILSPSAVDTARTEVSYGPDATSMLPSRFGLGFHLHHEFSPLLTSDSFGHGGMGGSLAFADVHHEIGFGYVMNQMRLDGDRSRALVDALRSCL